MKQINKKQFEKNGVLWWHCKKYAKEFSEYDERITIGSIYTTYCELNRKIKNNKKEYTSEKLCRGFPKELEIFIDYIKHLEFTEVPDYDYLRNLLKKL